MPRPEWSVSLGACTRAGYPQRIVPCDQSCRVGKRVDNVLGMALHVFDVDRVGSSAHPGNMG